MQKKYGEFIAVFSILLGIIILFFETGRDPLNNTRLYLDTDIFSNNNTVQMLSGGDKYEEEFYCNTNLNVAAISIRTVTWNKHLPKDSNLYMDIIDKDNGNIIGKHETSLRHCPDNELITFPFYDNVDLQGGKRYRLCFYTDAIKENENNIALMLSDVSNRANACFIQDESKDICVKIYVKDDLNEG